MEVGVSVEVVGAEVGDGVAEGDEDDVVAAVDEDVLDVALGAADSAEGDAEVEVDGADEVAAGAAWRAATAVCDGVPVPDPHDTLRTTRFTVMVTRPVDTKVPTLLRNSPE